MRLNEYRYEVEFENSDLQDGETRSGQVCPACNGGSSKEKSFSVSRSGGVLLYNCFRATCNFGGAIGSTKVSSRSGSISERDRNQAYIGTAPLNPDDVKFLAEKFGLTGDAIELAGIKRTSSTTGIYSGRICFPIYGPDLRQRGACYRSYSGATPKSLTQLNDSGAIAMSWYVRKRKSKALVIVEDQVSAIKLSSFYDSVALLSTNLSEAKVKEIADKKYPRVYLCLDNDATNVAVNLMIKLRYKLPSLQMIGLDKDIKNMNKEEFASFLNKLEE